MATRGMTQLAFTVPQTFSAPRPPSGPVVQNCIVTKWSIGTDHVWDACTGQGPVDIPWGANDWMALAAASVCVAALFVGGCLLIIRSLRSM